MRAQREQLELLAQQVVRLLESRQSNQTRLRLSQFIERSSVMVAMLDVRAGVFSYTNQRWHARCGQQAGEDAAGITRLLPKLDAALLGDDAGTPTRPLQLSHTPIHYSPTEHSYADVQLFPDSEDAVGHGFPRQLLIVVEDLAATVAEQRQARSTRQKAQLLERVASITNNPVIITNALRRIEWVNRAFESTTGYSAAEAIGKNPAFLQGPDTSSEAVKRISARVRQGRGVVEEILNYAKDGRMYWLELDIQPIFDDNDTLTHFVAVQTNITRRKQQEEEYRRAKQEAERASRLKSQFVAHVSHELRTPLNGILGISEYLAQSAPEAFTPDLLTLHHSGKHLLSLLNELIDLSAIEAGSLAFHRQPFCPAKVAEEVLQLFEANASAKGLATRLELNSHAQKLWVLGDPKRLRQVLMNLIGNAIKFTESGVIVLSCMAATTEGEASLDFAIADTGPGIDEADQDRIFKPFERSASANAGAGLGLSISRQILQLMGSDLALESCPGKGSRFYFTLRLPASDEPDARAETPGPSPESERLLAKQVLVVDDNATNLLVMKGMLKALSVSDVHVAQSAKEALRLRHGRR